MKLNTKKTIYVGFAFLIICIFWQVYDNIIAKMLINSFGFNQTWSGVIMALDNVLALFMLPLFGMISDRTNTKYGKRTPFIFWGVIISAVLFTGVALIDMLQQNAVVNAGITSVITNSIDGNTVYQFNGVDYLTKEAAALARSELVMQVTRNNTFLLVAFIGILLLVLIAMATYRTPAVSLMPDVTVKPLRSKANAIINLMGAVGGIIALGLMSFLAKDYQSYVLLFIVVAVLMIALLMFFMWKVKEPKLVEEMHLESQKYGLEEASEETNEPVKEKMSPEVKKSFLLIIASIVFWFMAYNAATTKFSIYSQDVLDMGFTLPLLIAQAAAIVCFIPIGIIASKVGRKKTIIVGILILTVAFILGIIATPSTKVLIYFTMAMAGIGWATINVNSYPMIVEMSKGSNIGKYTGYYYTASMAAQIVTPVLSGFLMDKIGLRVLFPYSVVFCLLALSTMLFVKHGDSKPIPSKALEDLEA